MTATLSANLLGFTEDFIPPEHLEERLDILANYDLWFVEERLKARELLPEDRIAPSIQEFRRFIAIRVLGHICSVPSQEVDEVWHAFILFTKDYAEFCKRVCGSFIHHVPHTSRGPKLSPPSEPYSEVYKGYFGSVREERAGSCWCFGGSCSYCLAHQPEGGCISNSCGPDVETVKQAAGGLCEGGGDGDKGGCGACG